MERLSNCCESLKRDRTKIATLTVFVVDIVILVIVLGLLWGMPEPKTPGGNCGYMCLPCTTDPNKVCCGCRAKMLEEYLGENFGKLYAKIDTTNRQIYNDRVGKAKIYGGYIGDVKPVAHMIGEQREPSDKKAPLPVTKWYQGNNCLLLNGVSIYNGRLRVPATGFYHVYSMLDISYHIGNNSGIYTIPSERQSLEVSIFKSNIKTGMNKEMKILSSYHPYDYSRNQIFGRFDTFISSDMHLNAGDEVYVKVSNISQVNSPPKNIIGIYMI